MFDIGFWELCLIAVVALLILGPERLPTAARTAGKWFGKIRGLVNNVKDEIDRELRMDEIRSKMEEQEKELREKSGVDDIQDALDLSVSELDPIERSPETDFDREPTEDNAPVDKTIKRDEQD